MKLPLFLFAGCLTLSSFAQESEKTIHVFVALCDNEFQGIVKVPAQLGNGKSPATNLYWGALYGVKSYFKKDADWQLVQTFRNPEKYILERCIFKHPSEEIFLVADAYDGEYMNRCVNDFLESAAGGQQKQIMLEDDTVFAGGNAELLCFVGHNGLMDFSLDKYPVRKSDAEKDVIILACVSRNYFAEPLNSAGAHPLLWTTGLMSPEAYTLEAAIAGWILNETAEQIRTRAAEAYNQYQKCGIKGARNLLVTGK
ncbi:MAG: hypothetical protein SH857_12040 [Chitinophagales bacterium]|nr:hypothetical protein [Chitinophagales bacterium]